MRHARGENYSDLAGSNQLDSPDGARGPNDRRPAGGLCAAVAQMGGIRTHPCLRFFVEKSVAASGDGAGAPLGSRGRYMPTPERKQRISRLALRRGIHRTRERELAAVEHVDLDPLGPMGPPPTAASIVRGRERAQTPGGPKTG